MSHKFPVIEEPDNAVQVEKALNAALERGPSRRFRKERERALSHTPKSTLLSLLITKEYASRQTRQLLDVTLSQLTESTRRLTLAESADTPRTRYTSDVSPQLSAKVLQSLNEAQETASKAQNSVNAYKLQLEEAQREIFRAQEAMRVVERQRDEAEKKAAEAREIARQIREEQLFILAKEEGRRDGFESGFEHGRQLAKAQRERKRVEAERRRSRHRIEDAPREPPTQATPASEAPLPVPPPASQAEEPPPPRTPEPLPEPPPPQVVPQVMNVEPPPPRRQPHFTTERTSSTSSRSSRSSLRRQPAFEPIQEQSPDVFLSNSPGRDPNALVSFQTQPSVTSSQLGPEVTPTPSARPPSQEVIPMPEPIVMPQPMPRERPRSTSSSSSVVPPPGIILGQRPASVASSTPRARPASVASITTPTAPPPGVISSVATSRPSSVAGIAPPMPYLRMPEPPPSLARSSSSSSSSTSVHSGHFGTAPPPPPPVVAPEPAPRQRGSQRHSSSEHSFSYGTAPPPPPMVVSEAASRHSSGSRPSSTVHSTTYGVAPPPPPPEPIARQPSRSSSGSGRTLSYRTQIYSNAPPSQAEYIPHRTRTSSLSSTGSSQRPYSRPGTASDAARRSPDPQTPSSSATGFSQLELMNFPNPAAEYISSSRRERRDSLRDRERDRYVTQLTAIPEHLTGSSRASQSPLHRPIPPMTSSPHSTFDPSLQPPPLSAQSWSSITTVPTPSSISSWLPPANEEPAPWGPSSASSLRTTNPEIVVTPEREQVPFIPPPIHLEQDNFLGPSSAQRGRDGLYSSGHGSSSSLDSHRLSTSSTGSVGITIEPPSRPSSVTGGSRPPSAAGHGYLSPNSAHMPLPSLPTQPSPQPAPVIPAGTMTSASSGGGLPWNFVPMAMTPSQPPATLYDASSSGPSSSGRPYSPYAPKLDSSSEAPVIPSMEGRSKSRSEGRAGSSGGAQRKSSYAAAPTPPGFSYPAPVGSTPGAGSYLRTLPKRGGKNDTMSDSESTRSSESDGDVSIHIVPPPETRNVSATGRRVAFS